MSKEYPGKCPSCGLPAYVGAVPADVKCSSLGDCPHRERRSMDPYEIAKAGLEEAIKLAKSRASLWRIATTPYVFSPSVTVPPFTSGPVGPAGNDDYDDDDGDTD